MTEFAPVSVGANFGLSYAGSAWAVAARLPAIVAIAISAAIIAATTVILRAISVAPSSGALAVVAGAAVIRGVAGVDVGSRSAPVIARDERRLYAG